MEHLAMRSPMLNRFTTVIEIVSKHNFNDVYSEINKHFIEVKAFSKSGKCQLTVRLDDFNDNAVRVDIWQTYTGSELVRVVCLDEQLEDTIEYIEQILPNIESEYLSKLPQEAITV